MAHIELFPVDLRNLMKEINTYHPDLVAQLKTPEGNNGLETWFATVATYADVLLDGSYHAPDLPGLCVFLTDKLYRMRTSLVVIGARDVPGSGDVVSETKV